MRASSVTRERPVRSVPRFVVMPAGAEHQPVVLDKPEVLVFNLSSDGVHVFVGHPDALLGGPEGPVVKHLFEVHSHSSAL